MFSILRLRSFVVQRLGHCLSLFPRAGLGHVVLVSYVTGAVMTYGLPAAICLVGIRSRTLGFRLLTLPVLLRDRVLTFSDVIRVAPLTRIQVWSRPLKEVSCVALPEQNAL